MGVKDAKKVYEPKEQLMEKVKDRTKCVRSNLLYCWYTLVP